MAFLKRAPDLDPCVIELLLGDKPFENRKYNEVFARTKRLITKKYMISFVYEDKTQTVNRVVIDLLSVIICVMEDAVDEEN